MRIIKILSDKEILINAGANEKLKKGDVLEIYLEGEKITDPDTNKVLGTLDKLKACVKVATVYEQMAICESIKTIDSLSEQLGKIAFAQQKIMPLNVELSEISGELLNFDKTIRIGDKVRRPLG